jgi:hypothetical protein
MLHWWTEDETVTFKQCLDTMNLPMQHSTLGLQTTPWIVNTTHRKDLQEYNLTCLVPVSTTLTLVHLAKCALAEQLQDLHLQVGGWVGGRAGGHTASHSFNALCTGVWQGQAGCGVVWRGGCNIQCEARLACHDGR